MYQLILNNSLQQCLIGTHKEIKECNKDAQNTPKYKGFISTHKNVQKWRWKRMHNETQKDKKDERTLKHCTETLKTK